MSGCSAACSAPPWVGVVSEYPPQSGIHNERGQHRHRLRHQRLDRHADLHHATGREPTGGGRRARVSRRVVSSAAVKSSNSWPRARKLDSCRGKLCGRASLAIILRAVSADRASVRQKASSISPASRGSAIQQRHQPRAIVPQPQESPSAPCSTRISVTRFANASTIAFFGGACEGQGGHPPLSVTDRSAAR